MKKYLVDTIPQHYVLERWTINAKNHIIHGISNDDLQVETQNSSTLMRNSLMLKIYDVVEVGCQSKRKYDHFSIGLQKMHDELLMMDDDCDKDINDVDVGSVEGHVFNNQVLSNLAFTLQDPPHVSCRGKPKSLRQKKNPKENQTNKKRTCSICKKIGHVRTNCPSHKHARYSYNLFFIIYNNLHENAF
jgi:hypothetical protein